MLVEIIPSKEEDNGGGGMKEEYKPKTPQEKLGYLIEECGEVLAASGKLLRWGADSYNPEPETSNEDNSEWLNRELKDLRRAIKFVQEIINNGKISDI